MNLPLDPAAAALALPAAANTPPSPSVEGHIGTVLGLSQAMLRDVQEALERINRVNQTIHILSMNARVEAARAGDAGRGFAVVAEALTRLSAETDHTAREVAASTQRTADQLSGVAGQLSQDITDDRLCNLAHNAIDLVDRNLYERSCDVRWWATDSALVDCASQPDAARVTHACRRLGQILDSYTVYADLLLVDLNGRVLANGRPGQYTQSIGAQVGHSAWFNSAVRQRSGTEFSFESVHTQPLIGDERALVYACTVREGGQVQGRALGVLGIVFRWDALGPTVLQATPFSAQEWPRCRAVLVDDSGRVLADNQLQRIGQPLDFAGRDTLLRQARGAVTARVDGRLTRIGHARSQGFETYATGWHALMLRQAE